MFAPDPRATLVPLGLHQGQARQAVLLDDVLADPEALVALAERHREAFRPAAGNAFPGPELPLPDGVMQAWSDLLRLHARAALGVRRIVRAHGRLSLVTQAPLALRPMQRLCHRDRLQVAEGEIPIACVLYLFRDEALGGTAFYRPRPEAGPVDALMQQAAAGGHAWLDAQLGPGRGYMTGSNRWFEQTAVVPARFNRALFYRGDLFHSAHIEQPARLSDDMRQGRLMLNGFFTCTVQRT